MQYFRHNLQLPYFRYRNLPSSKFSDGCLGAAECMLRNAAVIGHITALNSHEFSYPWASTFIVLVANSCQKKGGFVMPSFLADATIEEQVLFILRS